MNKESWIGSKVPVIPFTINQYTEIIKHIYKENKNIYDFINLVELVNENAIYEKTFKSWENNIEKIIDDWKTNNKQKQYLHL